LFTKILRKSGLNPWGNLIYSNPKGVLTKLKGNLGELGVFRAIFSKKGSFGVKKGGGLPLREIWKAPGKG